jgi:hypothetical protein
VSIRRKATSRKGEKQFRRTAVSRAGIDRRPVICYAFLRETTYYKNSKGKCIMNRKEYAVNMVANVGVMRFVADSLGMA